MPLQETIEAVSRKLKKLKHLEDDLAKTVASRVNKLSEDCFKALATDSHNVTTMVMFRLDCLSEFLQNIYIKVQDGGQRLDNGVDTDQYSAGMKSLSCLVEGLDKLESVTEAQRESSQEAQIQMLQAKFAELESRVKEGQILPSSKRDQNGEVQKTEIASLKSELGNLKKEHIRLADQLKKIDKEKETMEAFMKQEIDRIEKEKTAMETDLKQELERLNVDKRTLADQMEGSNKERKEREMSMKEEMIRLEKEKKQLRAKFKKVADKQKNFKRSASQKQSEMQNSCAALAKKVSSLEVLRDVLNQLNQRAQSQPNTLKLAQDAHTDISMLDYRLNLISRPKVAFQTHLKEALDIKPNTVIRPLIDSLNVGNCFREIPSHFVAPHDGLYAFSVRVIPSSVGYTVCLMLRDKGCVAECMEYIPIQSGAHHSFSCLLELNQDQRVFLKITHSSSDNGNSQLDVGCVNFCGWSVEYT